MHTFTYTFRKRNGWGVTPSGAFPAPTHCHECGAALPEKKPDAITSGYGCGAGVHVGDSREGDHIEQSPAVCYACCHKHDVDQLRDTSRPFFAYVACDGKSITNWPGYPLARVVEEWESRGAFGRSLNHYRCVDVHGRRWHGKGSGRGMCITLRACK